MTLYDRPQVIKDQAWVTFDFDESAEVAIRHNVSDCMAIPVFHVSDPTSLILLGELGREASFHKVLLVASNDRVALFVDWAVVCGDPQNVWPLVLLVLEVEASKGQEGGHKPLSILVRLRLDHELDLSFEDKQQVEVRVAVSKYQALQRRQWHRSLGLASVWGR